MAADKYVTQLRTPVSLAGEVRAFADRHGVSFNSAVCMILREKMDQEIVENARMRELALQNS